MKLPPDMTVENALEVYNNDSDVEYAEPNYYVYFTKTPDDISFSKLWGLHNTGQSVNETSGTSDADIDAPEAWEITTGSSDVVVAVVDSGVDYNHPDLSANIWTNAGEIEDNGIDDDGNGYVDDVRGWDFVDDDNVPLDSHDHGTHVAGIIAAVGDNATGITGVGWTAKIMVLKAGTAFGTIVDTVSAIEYASANGAHIINCSYGSPNFSQTEKDAIDASSAVVICAAGNDGTNNDISPNYPSDYTSSNIISVAATDQNDGLATFDTGSSNFGVTSVDVAAPGTNIYSSRPSRQTVWSDNFDDNDISDWSTGGKNNTWGTTDEMAVSGSYSLTDSPGANYQNDTDSWIRAPGLDLSTFNGSKLEFKIRGHSEAGYDYLELQVSTDLANWLNMGIIYDDYSDDWYLSIFDLGAYDGQSTVYIRFRFISDSTNVNVGWYIDDVIVTAASSSYDGTEYQFFEGTSMAAPIVSGIAALVKAQSPALTHTEIKSAIENGVDAVPALEGTVATGGRVNAVRALKPLSPSNLSATVESSAQIDLSWADNSSNESGFKIERKICEMISDSNEERWESDGTEIDSGGIRSVSGGNNADIYVQIAAVSEGVTSFSDTDCSDELIYYYRVRSYNPNGNSDYSNEGTTMSVNSGGGGGGLCFIATAAFGSSLEPNVKILRQFRDRFLIDNKLGKSFVSFYNAYSPPIAGFITSYDSLRSMVRVLLLPVIGMSWFALRFGLASTMLVISFFGVGVIGLTVFLIRNRRTRQSRVF